MPDWPGERIGDCTFYSNVTEWVRLTGRLPDYVSATFSMTNGGILCPVYIPKAMIVRALYVANGASVAGTHQVALVPSTYAYGPNLAFPDNFGGIFSVPTLQAGVNVWQRFAVTETRIGPGQYYFAYAASGSTGTVQRLYNPLGATSWEAWFGGVKSNVDYPLQGGDSAMPVGIAPIIPVLAVGGV